MKTHLRQCNVGNDNSIEGARGVLWCLAHISARMVLIFEVIVTLPITLRLPWHGAVSHADRGLGRGCRGLAAEIVSCETESAGHNTKKDLDWAHHCQYMYRLVFHWERT